MADKDRYSQKESAHKRRINDGVTPKYKAFNEVYVTKDLGSRRNDELVAFVAKYIDEYKGHKEDKHGIPLMLFDRKKDAQTFTNEVSARLNIQKEHITIKARKFTRLM
jgi:aromatic ring-opening dioxygenase catalytic subunit (LigB family)